MILAIKRYWKIAFGLLLFLAGFLLRFLGARSASRKIENKLIKERADHLKGVMAKDLEIEREHDIRTEELANEIKQKKTSSELSNPNDW